MAVGFGSFPSVGAVTDFTPVLEWLFKQGKVQYLIKWYDFSVCFSSIRFSKFTFDLYVKLTASTPNAGDRRGWPETANTWEPLQNLLSCSDVIDAFEERYPSLSLLFLGVEPSLSVLF